MVKMAQATTVTAANRLDYVIQTVLKEARQEDRLVRQLIYAGLSAYTQNPVNLAINAPSGEGKSYTINKVFNMFPKCDVISLVGMTDKALFHTQGKFVIKNEKTGELEDIEPRLNQIELELLELKKEEDDSGTNNKAKIRALEEERKELHKSAIKLIDLQHKILIFFDTPRPELFAAMMPLLSHDKFEVEYMFVDTNNNGIKTKTNILRGWPTVIFAQAVDYSNHPRYQEIARRFIIVNPKMSSQKYQEANALTATKLGLPDFVYQKLVVSDSEKERARDIIKNLKEDILDICQNDKPGKNNVFVPFAESIVSAMPNHSAADMTTTHRFFTFLSLLPIIYAESRPKLKVIDNNNGRTSLIPLATFADLRETVFLMEYANGVRPYILEWYMDVFQPTYNSKSEPDSIERKGDLITEGRIAVTTDELKAATEKIQGKQYSTHQLLQTFVYPLLNQNYIDKTESQIDKRTNIYYPIVETKYIKLFYSEQKNNFVESPKINIANPTQYPDQTYVISKIQAIVKYSSSGAQISLLNHKEEPTTEDELAQIYYADTHTCFTKKEQSVVSKPSIDIPSNDQSVSSSNNQTNVEVVTTEDNGNLVNSNNDSCTTITEEQKSHLKEEYHANAENGDILQETNGNSEINIASISLESTKLFYSQKKNNLIYSNGPKTTLFEQIFNGLAKTESENQTVKHEALHREMVVSGKWNAGDATQMIEEFVKSGKLKAVDWHVYKMTEDGDQEHNEEV